MRTTKFIQIAVVLIGLLPLPSHADLDEALKETADELAPQDPVTGKRVLNTESETAEIQRAEQQTQQILSEARQNGFAVDTDQATLTYLQDMMQRIAKVSHRPNLPWEVHLIESPEVNAKTIGGGKIFIYRGLFSGMVTNDDELAAVMAHEMGHVTARHVSKSQSNQLIELFSKKSRKTLYKASFTTLQEDEADRIGLLYMSLAGYNPSVVPQIWQRANQKYGGTAKDYNYAYDHSLNSDRANKTGSLASLAMNYFSGEGVTNSNYQEVLASSTLLPRNGFDEGGNGYIAALNSLLDNYMQHLQTRNEALSREVKMYQDKADTAAIQRLTRIDFQSRPANDGKMALMGNFQNGSNRAITGATITVYYINRVGQPVYTEDVALQSNYVPPGQVAHWAAYMRSVPGASDIRAAVTNVNWAH